MSSSLLNLQEQSSSDKPPTSASGQPVPRPGIRWWSRVIIPALIICGAALLLLGAAWQQLVPALPVTVEPAVAKTVTDRRPGQALVQAAGWLEAYPYLTHVGALTSGVATEILVLEGDRVEAGQVVARLDDAEAELALQRVQAECQVLEAELARSQARLDAAQRAWDHPVELDRRVAVARADVARQQAELAEAGARIAERQAHLAQARRDAARATRLAEQAAGSEQAAEQAAALVAAHEAALQASERAAAAAEQRLQRARSDLQAAERNQTLRLVDRAELEAATTAHQQARAALKLADAKRAEAELRHQRMEIIAPIDGIVVRRYKSPGDKVMLQGDEAHSASIISLYDPAQLQARVDIPLADAGQISVGQPCEITTDVLPNRTFRGRVLRVLHQADIQKNTLQAKVAIADPDAALRPEMLCRVRFLPQTQENEDAPAVSHVFVPGDAVVNNRVWLARHDADGSNIRAESLPVENPLERDGWLSVDGLHPGALVIVDPPRDLEVGQRLKLTNEGDRP